MVSNEEMRRMLDVQMADRRVKVPQLCKAVGISPQSYSGYVNGKVRMPLPVLSRICSYLGMTKEERGAFLM